MPAPWAVRYASVSALLDKAQLDAPTRDHRLDLAASGRTETLRLVAELRLADEDFETVDTLVKSSCSKVRDIGAQLSR